MHHKIAKLLTIFSILTVVVYVLASNGGQHYGSKMSILDSLHYSSSLATLSGYSKATSRSNIAKAVDILAVFAGVWAVVI
jgi:hypothetical protein